MNVADAAAVGALVAEAAGAHGRLDVMCNIAGVMIDGPVLEIHEARGPLFDVDEHGDRRFPSGLAKTRSNGFPRLITDGDADGLR